MFCHTMGVLSVLLGRDGFGDRRHDERAQVLHGGGGRERLGRPVPEHDEVTNLGREAEDHDRNREGDDQQWWVVDASTGGREDPTTKLVLELVSCHRLAHLSLRGEVV